LKVGRNDSDLDTIPFRKAGDPMDQAPPLFDGTKQVAFNGGWDEDARVTIVQDQPLPGHVMALIPHVTTSEE
jgi:hypothetical protein